MVEKKQDLVEAFEKINLTQNQDGTHRQVYQEKKDQNQNPNDKQKELGTNSEAESKGKDSKDKKSVDKKQMYGPEGKPNPAFQKKFTQCKSFKELMTYLSTWYTEKDKKNTQKKANNARDFEVDFPIVLKDINCLIRLIKLQAAEQEIEGEDMIQFKFILAFIKSCTPEGDIPNRVLKDSVKQLEIMFGKNEDFIKECQPLITNKYLGEIRGQLVYDLVKIFKLKPDVEAMNKIAASHLKQKWLEDGVEIILAFKMTSRFDLKYLIVQLADQNQGGLAKQVIQQADDKEITRKCLDALSTPKNNKFAFKLIKELPGFEEKDFPKLLEINEMNALNYFFSRMFRAPDHADYMSVHKVEDLLSGYPNRLMHLCTKLLTRKPFQQNQGKGVFLRNNLDGHPLCKGIQKQMDEIEYNLKWDGLVEDKFGPMDNKKFRLPKDFKVTFVDTEKQIPTMLKGLLDADYIGMDAEWRPQIAKTDACKTALFQLSSRKEAFLVDLISLADNLVLDEALSQIFQSEKTCCLGFSFSSDLAAFKQAFTKMTFFQNFAYFLDVQDYYSHINSTTDQVGLAKVAKEMLGQEICKHEQMSNWERRPLRLSQQHYGALDGYSLIIILEKLEVEALKNKKKDINDSKKPFNLKTHSEQKAKDKEEKSKAKEAKFKDGKTGAKKGDKCYHCEQSGHFARDCPKKPAEEKKDPEEKKQGAESLGKKPIKLCHNCKKEGHVSRGCPQFKKCNTCCQEGHLQKDCTSATEEKKTGNSTRKVTDKIQQKGKQAQSKEQTQTGTSMKKAPRAKNRTVEISKTLSFILRHGATKEGLNITSDGYVSVKELLAWKGLTDLQATPEEIDQVVDTNEKKRFEFNEQKTLIRAAQGHTQSEVKTEDLLNKIENPFSYCEVIHGTYYEPLDIIMKKGLNKMARNNIHMAIGLPAKQGVISGMRSSCEVVIELNMVKAMYGKHKIPFYVSSNKVILSEGLEDGSIPAEYFRSVIDFKKKNFIHQAPIDYICVYDFEATCEKNRGQTMKSQEIIEFPIVIVDVKTKSVKNIYQTYIKPVIDPQLSDFCNELTGITQKQVDEGILLKQALDQVHEFLEKEGLFEKEFVFMSCGDFDGNLLKREATEKKIEVPNYMKRWINLKKVWPVHIFPDPAKTSDKKSIEYDFSRTDTIDEKCKPAIGGMEQMLDAAGLKLEGKHHSGLDDSKNIARCVIALLEKGFQFTQGMVHSKPYYTNY